jgi:hypothetical protein
VQKKMLDSIHEKGTEKRIKLVHILILLVALVLLVLLFSQNTFGTHTLVINELMTSNRSTIADEDGDYSDWIELFNSGNFPLNLDGFWLSDDPTNPLKWELPSISIGPQQHLLIFASGKNRRDPNGPYLHTNFRLSASGDSLILSTPDVRIIDSVETEEMYSNISLGRASGMGNTWVYFFDATPGSKNSNLGVKTIEITPASDQSVYINEFMTTNRTSVLDDDGDLTDWVEIYNSGESPKNLKDYWLSDKDDNPFKWRFPEIVIAPGEYLLIFASGKNRAEPEKALHTNFKLNDTNDTLVFSTPSGQLIDGIKVRNMIPDVSYGRNEDNTDDWLYYPAPTPGRSNDTQGFEELSGKTLPASFNLHINEAMTMNTDTITDEDGDYEDWIEIYNSGEEAVNLFGFGLSDKDDDPFHWQFPDVTIEGHSFLLVFASGKDRVLPDSRNLHTNFRLSSSGETVILTAPTGMTVDELATGRLVPGLSAGRYPDGEAERFFFKYPSPGAGNSSIALQGFAPEPLLSQHGGFHDDSLSLTMTLPFTLPGTIIRYTLNGKEPDASSTVYTGPITLGKTTVVRARVFAEGLLPSKTINETFLINEDTTLTVLSVFIDPKDLWDPREGIYVMGYNAQSEFPHVGANFWKDMEKPIHLQLFETNGKLGLSMDAGIKIAGQYSRAMPQKSFNIFARNRYGSDVIEYPFFPGKTLTTQKAITLRTSGQDATMSKIRDSMMTSLLSETDLDYQAYRAAVVFINGEYWGAYNIRERINKYFIAYTHGIDPESVDLLQGNTMMRAGNSDHYVALRSFIANNDMRQSQNYDYVQTQMDVQNFMDYWIAQMYFANTDSANIRFWRERTEGAKWRWIVYDTDWGFFNVNHNTVYYVTNPEGTGVGRRLSTVLLANLLKNNDFKEEFLQRFAYHLNYTFAPERVINIIDEIAGDIEPEMPSHFQRWGGTVNSWQTHVQSLRNFAQQRPAIVVRHIQRKFNLTNAEMNVFDAWKNQ